MRIIGGAFGGRKIRAPRGQETRPTSDKVRQAVFDILGPPPEEAAVLDLFAGAGGLGLEALSRGAARAVFVDRAAEPCRVITENARALGVEDRVAVVRGELPAALARVRGGPFAWIFVDPPYAGDLTASTLAALARSDLAIGLIVVEHDRRNVPDDAYGPIRRDDRRRWGDTEVSFYRSS